jgi:hypothetical protein
MFLCIIVWCTVGFFRCSLRNRAIPKHCGSIYQNNVWVRSRAQGSDGVGQGYAASSQLVHCSYRWNEGTTSLILVQRERERVCVLQYVCLLIHFNFLLGASWECILQTACQPWRRTSHWRIQFKGDWFSSSTSHKNSRVIWFIRRVIKVYFYFVRIVFIDHFVVDEFCE